MDRSTAKRRTPTTFEDFEILLQGCDDVIAICVRARRWRDLQGALTEYAGLLQMEVPFLLFLVLYRWALRSNMTLPQAITLLRDWDPRRDAVGGADDEHDGQPADQRAAALAVFARMASTGQAVN